MTPVELSRTVLRAVRRAVDVGELRVDVPARAVVTVPGPGGCGDYATNIALQLARPAGRPPRQVAEILRAHLTRTDGVAGVEITGPGFLNIRLDRAADPVAALVREIRSGEYGHGDALAGQVLRFRIPYDIRAEVVADTLVRIVATQGGRAEVLHRAAAPDTPRTGDEAPAGDGVRPGDEARPTSDAPAPGDGVRPGEAARPGDSARPASEAPTSEAPAGNGARPGDSARPASEAPASEAPAGNGARPGDSARPASEAPASEAPAGNGARPGDSARPASEAPASEAPAGNGARPGDSARPASEAPASEAPAGNGARPGDSARPASEAPTSDAPAGNGVHPGDGVRPTSEAPVGPILVDLRPVPAPEDPTPLGADAARWALLHPAGHDRPRVSADHLVQRAANPLFRVRYAHARTRALTRNAARLGFAGDPGDPQAAHATAPLVRALADHPPALRAAAVQYAPDRLARHLVVVADAVLGCQHTVLPLGDEKPSAAHRARLALAEAAGSVLAGGLSLLGISAPDYL